MQLALVIFAFTVNTRAPSIPAFFCGNAWDTNEIQIYAISEIALGKGMRGRL
jgi:hypothetical protein